MQKKSRTNEQMTHSQISSYINPNSKQKTRQYKSRQTKQEKIVPIIIPPLLKKKISQIIRNYLLGIFMTCIYFGQVLVKVVIYFNLESLSHNNQYSF